jgi:hypothetical protein
MTTREPLGFRGGGWFGGTYKMRFTNLPSTCGTILNDIYACLSKEVRCVFDAVVRVTS